MFVLRFFIRSSCLIHVASFHQEHDDIPEVLVDLQYSLAKSYSSTPELRETWLEHMAVVHESQENYSEVSHKKTTTPRVHGLKKLLSVQCS